MNITANRRGGACTTKGTWIQPAKSSLCVVAGSFRTSQLNPGAFSTTPEDDRVSPKARFAIGSHQRLASQIARWIRSVPPAGPTAPFFAYRDQNSCAEMSVLSCAGMSLSKKPYWVIPPGS